MRFVTLSSVSFVLLALSTLAGCATSTTATRGNDTAVRAEVRRISNARPYTAQQLVRDSLDTSERSTRAL
jgi:hypothetical protein